MCVSQSLNILRKLTIENYILDDRLAFYFHDLAVYYLTFQHATSDHLTWTEICIKIKRKSNIILEILLKILSLLVKMSKFQLETVFLKSIIIVITR